MNEHPLRTGRRVLRRVAALTATAVGAALLTATGPAAAQEPEFDCAALGALPTADGLAPALEAAITCGVEVRVQSKVSARSTLFATPQGQLHLVATAAPAQPLLDGTYADPVLTERDGSLVQSGGPVVFRLAHTDPLAPLVTVGNAGLGWSEAVPEPVYEGAAAHYDGLAPGVDLTVDMGINSAGMRFTAADAEAWTTLAASLTIADDSAWVATAADGSIRWNVRQSPLAALQTTPFTIRDAAGTVTPVMLDLAGDGALTISSDEALATAEFPLTLATQLGFDSVSSNQWGSTTSAIPDLAVYQGRGGLDAPYFEAAGASGDAIVGPHCDAQATSTCGEAESYWGFRWPGLQQILSSDRHSFTHQVSAAVFSVDAAAAAACVAPDLRLADRYTPAATWNARPAVLGDAAAGTCEGAQAVYDVSATVATEWRQPGIEDTIDFAMTDSAETARFDGASARLDVYFDVAGFNYVRSGGTACHGRTNDSTPAYAGFSLTAWRPDLTGAEATWSATFTDIASGAAVVQTEPEQVVNGRVPVRSLAQALPDGEYELQYEFASAPGGPAYRPLPCVITVDTVNPEVVDVSAEEGPYYIGDTVQVEVTVADDGFPYQDGSSYLTADCTGWGFVCTPSKRYLSKETTTTFQVEPTSSGGSTVYFGVDDPAPNYGRSATVEIKATYDHADFDGDRHQDLMAVRKSDGKLMFFAGDGEGGFANGVSLGSGWGALDVVMAGDLDEDGHPDLLARDTATGALYLYPGDGKGGLDQRLQIGSGWNRMGLFTSAGDYDGDGHLDLLAVRKSDGKLYRYPGRGDGTFGAAVAIGSGWGGMDMLSTYGDLDRDGDVDLMARGKQDDFYYVYRGNGAGGFETGRRYLYSSLTGGGGSLQKFDQVASGADYTGDGHIDLLAVDSVTGRMVLRSYDENDLYLKADLVVGPGWGAYRLPATDADRTYDLDFDGRTDVLARRSSTGMAFFYGGNGSGGLNSATWSEDAFKGMDLVEIAGDLDGDGYSDAIARGAANGSLYLVPGLGHGQFDQDTSTRIGTGWNAMSAIVSGHDFDADGKIDIIAREKSTGYLWLYPGTGTGKVGPRVKIGSGWNAMSEITAPGDLNHDGRADVIAVRSSDGCMYFYAGVGNGTVKNGVKLGCGWNGMNAVSEVGDFNGDGHADFIARRKSDGVLFLYPGNGKGNFLSSIKIGTGWNAMDLIA